MLVVEGTGYRNKHYTDAVSTFKKRKAFFDCQHDSCGEDPFLQLLTLAGAN